jgi:hypothetical protein
MQSLMVNENLVDLAHPADGTTAPKLVAFLRSNFGTYTSDVKHVSQCLRDAENAVSQLESEIVSRQNKQQMLFLQIAQYKSLLAPIRRLPPEMLGRIFGFCCTESKIAEKVDFPVIRLSQVCAGWRELARSTSSLWARIYIDLTESPCPIGRIRSMLLTHLTLSKQSPLHLFFVSGNDIDASREVLRLIVPHSLRWETVFLDVARDFLLDTHLLYIKNKLPSLKELYLWPPTTADFPYPEYSWTADLFSSAPMLRSFGIGSLDGNFDDDEEAQESTDVRVPWKQITNLKLCYQRLPIVFQRLALASEAKSVIIDRCFSCSHYVPSKQPLVHDMEDLTIRVDDHKPHTTVYLRRLTLPKLVSLRLTGDESYPDTSFCVEDILSFLTRSSCNLTSLSLVDLCNSDLIVLELLSQLPMLVDLTIHERPTHELRNSTLTDYFMRSLSFNHNSCILPRLQSISLQVHSPFYIASFVRMVQSRWVPDLVHAAEMGVDCLKRVDLKFVGEILDLEEEALRPLRILRGAGLRFETAKRLAIFRESFNLPLTVEFSDDE